jgi:hypothetical protein
VRQIDLLRKNKSHHFMKLRITKRTAFFTAALLVLASCTKTVDNPNGPEAVKIP